MSHVVCAKFARTIKDRKICQVQGIYHDRREKQYAKNAYCFLRLSCCKKCNSSSCFSLKKGEATELFGSERNKGSLEGIVGNVMQSFGGTSVYLTIEEKAAHLLYFIVKNHPFVDGNKRSGAYAFIWFLHRAGILNRATMTSPALTALTLFIAESDPKNKERMIELVLQVLKK